MPWKTVSEMDQKHEFVRLAAAGGVGMAELCRRFGISRDTGYRLLSRYREEGEAGLKPRSRRPHHSPRRTAAALETIVLLVRDTYGNWGGRKIAHRLKHLKHMESVAPSTITNILHRHGRISAAASEACRPPQRFERPAPNQLWQMDFKGHFGLAQGRCHPLTLLDDHSRYSLCLQACANETDATVRQRLTAVFERYGLPEAILADNGAPWGGSGSNAPYTALGVWLLRHGIALYHGRPYHPQTQGKEERFHRTLKQELLQSNHFNDLGLAQTAFDRYRHVYNHERPHAALNYAVPASRYQPSLRSMPKTLPEPEYDSKDAIRRISRDGYFSFQGRTHRLSQAFEGLNIALRPTAQDGSWNIFFSRFCVATLSIPDDSVQLQPVRDVCAHLSGMSPV